MTTQTQSLTQSLFDPRLAGSYCYQPVQWLHHQVFHVTKTAQVQGALALLYALRDTVVRVFYAFLMLLALIPATVGLVYNFCAALYDPLPVEQQSATTTTAPLVQNNTDLKLTQIVTDFQQLEADFEKVFKDLNLLKGDAGASLEKRFNSLAACFAPYQEHATGGIYFKFFTEMHLQYLGLRRGRVSLFYDPPRFHDQSHTIPVSDKGNCLYEAVAKAIDLYNCRPSTNDMINSSVQYQLDPAQLRQDVVKWETQNVQTDSELRKRIVGAIATYLFDIRAKIQEYQDTNATFALLVQTASQQEQQQYQQGIENNLGEIARLEALCAPYENSETRITHYLEQAAKEGVWGTEAELYAIAQMYQVGIYVQAVKRKEQRMDSGKVEKEDTHFPEYDVKDLFPERTNQMKLKNANGVHYEPLVE